MPINTKHIIFSVLLIILIPLASATTLSGAVYNSDLELEKDVLISISTSPQQKVLAKDGTYEFELAAGTFEITAQKGAITTTETIEIPNKGVIKYDLFLLPDFEDTEDLWDTSQDDELFDEEPTAYEKWRYWLAGILALFLLWRFWGKRKKYGPLRKFRKYHREEHKKTTEQHKEEIAQEPGYLEKVVEIIKKNDGRITQKALRKELLHLSEAKVSLILTELEHKGKIEKVKKGRGNVILLK